MKQKIPRNKRRPRTRRYRSKKKPLQVRHETQEDVEKAEKLSLKKSNQRDYL